MAAWIIGIDEANPEHWDYAKTHGFWDMTVHRAFEIGDVLYFWQAGGSLLGSALVTEATHEIAAGTWMPWNLEDIKRGQYRNRVRFNVLDEASAGTPRWGELAAATGVRGATNFGPRKVPLAGESWLAAQVSGTNAVSTAARLWADRFEALLPEQAAGESLAEQDLRARTEAIIVLRRGQSQFRSRLLTAYAGRCAVTGTSIEGVLEAAHISPYKGEYTNVVSNGLILRSDIHTLFDLHLLTVVPDLTVRVAPEASNEPYSTYDGAQIMCPKRSADRPGLDVLSRHNEACLWLDPRAGHGRALF